MKNLALADDTMLINAMSAGSVAALAAFFDRTVAVVHEELAASSLDAARGRELLAASDLEVWWLAGCGTEPRPALVDWVLSLVRRRVVDALSGRSGHDARDPDHEGPGNAGAELAALLQRPAASRTGPQWF